MEGNFAVLCDDGQNCLTLSVIHGDKLHLANKRPGHTQTNPNFSAPAAWTVNVHIDHNVMQSNWHMKTTRLNK